MEKTNHEKISILRNTKGITLIVLIITIIILVILAAVSIRAVYNMKIVEMTVNGAQDYAVEAKREEDIFEKITKLIRKKTNNAEENKICIEYVLNGGENPEGQVVEFNQGNDITLLYAIKENAYFDGWYENREFNSKRINSTGDIEDDITLYAKWIEETQTDYFTWSTTSTSATITGFSEIGLAVYNGGNLTTLAIPRRYNNLIVTTIKEKAFSNMDNIFKLIIPDCITNINTGTFDNCINLKELTIPISISASPSNYGHGAFIGCTNVEKVNFTKGSGQGVNYQTQSPYVNEYYNTPWYLSSQAGKEIMVTFENGIESIGDYMFCGCKGIKLSNLGSVNTLTKIGKYAFQNCENMEISNLDSINLATTIGAFAFQNCKKIKGEINKSSGIINESSFENCISITKVAINIENFQVPKNMFKGCTGITNIEIGEKIKSLGVGSFDNCTSLKELTIPISISASPSNYGHGAFIGCTNVEKVNFTKGSGQGVNYQTQSPYVNEYYNTPWYISSQAGKEIMVTFENGIESIGNYMFHNCSGVKKIIYKNIEYTSIAALKTVFDAEGVTTYTNTFTNSGLNV